jgi:diaminopimelate epimerase
MRFTKYQALGNDYIILEPSQADENVLATLVPRLCDRHYGAGSDGVLWGPLPSELADFGLRIFNPDGSEAEKSGNGLRIFARYLYDLGLVQESPFTVHTPGGVVQIVVYPGGSKVKVEMGVVSFNSRLIPVTGPERQVLNELLTLGEYSLRISAATLGNPHCVVLLDTISPSLAQELGPLLENNPLFPRRINVQFMKILSRKAIAIEIWERGAGYTLASGSSACAAAAVAYRLRKCGRAITVHMPGGELQVMLTTDYHASLEGPVVPVYEGNWYV